MGKALGVPAYELLGGKVQEGYVVEGVGYGLSLDEPEIVAAKAREAVEYGYRQLEFKAGDAVDSARDIERLRLVREAIGDEYYSAHVPANHRGTAWGGLMAVQGWEQHQRTQRGGRHRAAIAIEKNLTNRPHSGYPATHAYTQWLTDQQTDTTNVITLPNPSLN